MDDNRRSKKINRSKKRKKRIFSWLVLPLLVIIISAVSYGTFLFNKAQSALDTSFEAVERDSMRESAVNPDVDNISVLFIGVDDSEEREYKASARSDALILATFNKDLKSVKLLSIPRDSYVRIPDHGKDKITHAHSYGGPATTIETVEKLLDIPVDYYVKMNFNAFVEVIDSLGGIKIDVPYAFAEFNSDEKKFIHLEPGFQELNGEETLALARTRKLDSDIERGKRQMEIINAIISKAASAGSVTKYGNVIEAVGENMTTDLSFKEMTAFIEYLAVGTSLNIESMTLEGSDLYLPNKQGNNIYYYKLDEEYLETAQNSLKSHLELNNTLVTDDDTEKDANTNEEDKYSSIN